MEPLDLPLFPLGTVLLPSMTLPLHIFEPRYRQMIAACLQHDRRFGVVLIREGEEVGETALPFDVGTVAEIIASTRLPDGRMNLIAEGRQRFRILERFYDRIYLHGSVEILDEPFGLPENTLPLADQARDLVVRYLHALLRQAQQDDELEIELPDEPVDFSYRFAGLWQQIHPSSMLELQTLLEAVSAEDRLRQEVLMLRREFAILDRVAHSAPPEQQGYFNPN
jgi:Lon protease-like protein